MTDGETTAAPGAPAMRIHRGLLGYGNIGYRTLPSGKRRLGTATTRSRRLPGRPLDKTGITPQVTVPKDDPDPIAFVIAHLKAGRRGA